MSTNEPPKYVVGAAWKRISDEVQRQKWDVARDPGGMADLQQDVERAVVATLGSISYRGSRSQGCSFSQATADEVQLVKNLREVVAQIEASPTVARLLVTGARLPSLAFRVAERRKDADQPITYEEFSNSVGGLEAYVSGEALGAIKLACDVVIENAKPRPGNKRNALMRHLILGLAYVYAEFAGVPPTTTTERAPKKGKKMFDQFVRAVMASLPDDVEVPTDIGRQLKTGLAAYKKMIDAYMTANVELPHRR